MMGLNTYQYLYYKTAIEAMNSEISEKEANISSLSSRLSESQKKAEDYEAKAITYQTICDYLNSVNAGYASNNFKASDSIIVISKSSTRKTFTLTSNFYTHVSMLYLAAHGL